MDLRHLNSFKKVAELQHMSHAAEELNIVQPALSRTIRSIEEELGINLFDRKGKSLSLNKYGQIVYKRTLEIFNSYENMITELAHKNDLEHSVIRIAFNSASLLMPPLVAAFHEKYSGIQIQFASHFKTAEANTVFRIDSFAEPQEGSENTLLLKEKCLLAFSEKHRFSNMDKITMEDLKGETFLYSKACHSVYDIVTRFCEQDGFTPTGMMECVSNSNVFSFLESGFGLALIPMATWEICQHKHIHTTAVEGRNFERYLYLNSSFPLDEYPQAMKFKEFSIDFFRKVERQASSNDLHRISILDCI